jgi:DNA-binding GntR family transcriptional regulator
MPDLSLAPLTPQPTQTATHQIFRALYDAVVSLELPPGAKLSEAEIAKRFDVSRQPVRDAFFQLSRLGFIAIRPQRATLVTKISERAVLDAAFIRTAIEVECLRMAMQGPGAQDLGRLRNALAQQRDAIDATDPAAFHACDEEFHALLCAMAGQDHAWELIQEKKAHMDRVRWLTLSVDRRHGVLAEHTAIVDALEAGDPLEAEQRLRAHLGDIRTTLPLIRQAHAAYFEGAD